MPVQTHDGTGAKQRPDGNDEERGQEINELPGLLSARAAWVRFKQFPVCIARIQSGRL